jgi:hypothetical protein
VFEYPKEDWRHSEWNIYCGDSYYNWLKIYVGMKIEEGILGFSWRRHVEISWCGVHGFPFYLQGSAV